MKDELARFLEKEPKKDNKITSKRFPKRSIGTKFPGGTLELLKRSGKDIVVHC